MESSKFSEKTKLKRRREIDEYSQHWPLTSTSNHASELSKKNTGIYIHNTHTQSTKELIYFQWSLMKNQASFCEYAQLLKTGSVVVWQPCDSVSGSFHALLVNRMWEKNVNHAGQMPHTTHDTKPLVPSCISYFEILQKSSDWLWTLCSLGKP